MESMTRSEQLRVRGQLLVANPRLAPVFSAVPPWQERTNGNVPVSLMHAIVGQQLSTKVAAVIWSRFQNACGGEVVPETVAGMSTDALRSCGLSGQKVGYLRNVAEFDSTHDLSLEHLSEMDDDEVIRLLTAIKGVGRWTVEMLLIFVLNRHDVLPVDDLGIQNAMRRLYGMRATGRSFLRRMEFYARPWRPHRSLVVRCLWRWMDTEPTD